MGGVLRICLSKVHLHAELEPNGNEMTQNVNVCVEET